MQLSRQHLVLVGLVIISLVGLTWYANSTPSDTKSPIQSSLDSLRQAREKQQKLENEISRGVWEKCYTESLTLSGKVFDEQQWIAYQCWTSEKQKLIYWTGNLTPVSEAPPKWIITKVSAAELVTVPRVDKKDTKQAKSEKPLPSVSPKSTYAQIVAKSSSIDDKYWKAYDTAIKMLRKYEGYAPVAKWDVKQCSWWYGRKAPCGMKISKSQADKWLAEDTRAWLSQVVKDFPNYTPEAQWALVSFRYNCPEWYASVKKNGIKYHSKWCKIAKDRNGNILSEYSLWLSTRRDSESRLIFKK